jgi:hypothetical protein
MREMAGNSPDETFGFAKRREKDWVVQVLKVWFCIYALGVLGWRSSIRPSSLDSEYRRYMSGQVLVWVCESVLCPTFTPSLPGSVCVISSILTPQSVDIHC